jgi:hypothetical protein
VEFTMEHLVPVAAGGETIAHNLALACFSCNRRKWDRRSGVDPQAGGEHQLFNPRNDRWNDHFAWSVDGLEIVGSTAIGRTTVKALESNRERLKKSEPRMLSSGDTLRRGIEDCAPDDTRLRGRGRERIARCADAAGLRRFEQGEGAPQRPPAARSRLHGATRTSPGTRR